MKLSEKHKKALEKITGKYWNYWNQDAVEAYFKFTDRGIKDAPKEQVALENYKEIMEYHHWQTVIVEMWKEDFKKGLLFLDDFLIEERPKAYIEYVFEIYKSVFGFIPSKYLIGDRINDTEIY